MFPFHTGVPSGHESHCCPEVHGELQLESIVQPALQLNTRGVVSESFASHVAILPPQGRQFSETGLSQGEYTSGPVQSSLQPAPAQSALHVTAVPLTGSHE